MRKKTTVSLWQEFSKGILKENPNLVGMLGICPVLAVTQEVRNALGMGLATTFVLICSNAVISLLRKRISPSVKLVSYIVVIAGFVTLTQFLLHGYAPELYSALGTFLSLITVNCIILGRAETFAGKHGVVRSVLDGAGMGAGFTLALLLVSSVREILGAGSWFGIPLNGEYCLPVLKLAPGGFFALGIVIALVSAVSGRKPPQKTGCSGCPNAETCAASKGGCSQ